MMFPYFRVHRPNVLLVVVVQVQENSRNDGELEEKPTLSLEVVQVVQLSMDHLQAAEERISKHCSLSQREILIVSKRKEVLLKDLERYEAELKSRRAKTARLREKFKVRMKEILQPGTLACARDTCDMFCSRTA